MNKAFLDTSALLRLLVKDDEKKMNAVIALLQNAGKQGSYFSVLPVTMLEIVWVLEKVYKLDRRAVREFVEAIINTPQLKVEKEEVFRKALQIYAEKNVKFADAVMGYWGLSNGLSTVFTYDEKHFKRIDGLEVKKP